MVLIATFVINPPAENLFNLNYDMARVVPCGESPVIENFRCESAVKTSADEFHHTPFESFSDALEQATD